MNKLRHTARILLVAASLFALPAHATDQSDLWWIPAESIRMSRTAQSASCWCGCGIPPPSRRIARERTTLRHVFGTNSRDSSALRYRTSPRTVAGIFPLPTGLIP